MPFDFSNQPAQSLVAQAGYASGIADYNQRLKNLQLQQQGLLQNERMQIRGIGASQYQQRYGTASDQFMQGQSIENQQVMQARGFENANYQLASSQQNQQVMQANDISAKQTSQMADQGFRAAQTAAQIAHSEASQVYGTAANLASRTYAATIHSALSSQDYLESMGLSDQSFTQRAALDNLQTSNSMELNRANIQTRLDFMPQLSEAEYNARQKQFSQKLGALDEALSAGIIDDVAHQAARQDLLAKQVELRSVMPSQSDAAKQFASLTFTDPTSIRPDDPSNIPMRYIRNPATGAYDLDPGVSAQIDQQRWQDSITQRDAKATMEQELATAKLISEEARNLMATIPGPIGPNGKPGRIPYNVAFAMARVQIMGQLKAVGTNPKTLAQ